MKRPDRKVLKLGISVRDLQRFVQAHEELGTETLAATLPLLLDAYEVTSRNGGHGAMKEFLLRKNIWFEPELWSYLKEIADAKGRTPSQMVADLLMKEWLAERTMVR